MGKIDHMNKGSLLRMVCEVTDLEGKDIGGIRIFDRHATFEVNNRVSSGIERSFKDVLVNGRPMRVNRDDVRENRKHRRSKGKKM